MSKDSDQNHTTSASQTIRTAVPALEEMLGRDFSVLDHGFVRVVDYMGGDAAVVQAARVSYGTGTKKISQDRSLIRYLMRHRHTTPFEMCEIKFHIKLPIFVARQWIRHRTANVNEYSARYSILDKEFYLPDREYLNIALAMERSNRQSTKTTALGQQQTMLLDDDFDLPALEVTAAQSATNKQGRGDILDENEASEALKAISRLSNTAYSTYKKLLNETDGKRETNPTRVGLARELARIVLPTNYYTQWYWKIDLHNLLHFISLRAERHAQAEIRAYADVIGKIVQSWVPHTWEAFLDYRHNSVHVSSVEVKLLKRMLSGDFPDKDSSGLSDREWTEFCEKFSLTQSSDENGRK